MNPNRELAGATLAHLAGLGVKHVIVCAGARNAPLVTSLLASPGRGGWRIWHHFDERAAAFFALGLAKKEQAPAAVVTTSGTAVAELLPAVIEAYYAGVPLVLVTADRPVTYRGSGAPQAIEQVGIFGPYAPVALDVSSAAEWSGILSWSRREPLHLNICFAEPGPGDAARDWETLEPVPSVEPVPPGSACDEGDAAGLEAFVANRDGLVVLLGELEAGWREPVEAFLVALGVPVWAEATSGLRESGALSELLLGVERQVAGLHPRAILRIGGVPSLRFWRELESREEIAVLSVTRRPFPGLARRSRLLVAEAFPCWSRGFSPLREPGACPQQEAPGACPHPSACPQQQALHVSLQGCLENHPGSEPAMMRALSAAIPAEALVFLGNSLPIREWNLAAVDRPAHSRCYASRGANGIDGQVATFLGLAAAENESWGIFGDLTALYDLNAPALLEQLAPARRRLVVINNGGGKIFSRLPALAALPDDDKEVTENHHSRSFKPWATMWGLGYVRWEAGAPFPGIGEDQVVLEVCPDGEATEAFWSEWK